VFHRFNGMFRRPPEYDDFITKLEEDEHHRIVYVTLEDPKLPEPGPSLDDIELDEALKEALRKRGIERLYKFQAKAIEYIRSGESTVIVAGTGMGKTEAFLLPILDDVIENPFEGVRALLVYPTKALARDQLARINALASVVFGARALVFDGDTSERDRMRIYSMPPPILVTNPDMIHHALMHSEAFREIVSKVRYVVLDDMHVYSGVFGTHVSYVLRRIRRFLKDDPVYIGSTATIGNPEEFAEAMFGKRVEVVKAEAGRLSPTYHVMVRPVARSKLDEVVCLLKKCMERGLKTLVFADSHRMVELIRKAGLRWGVDVHVHRAGLLPEERRAIEDGLRTGKIRAVAATPTLELGIDIGDLDCVILTNIPPTYSKYVQRTGRCGRRGRRAYVILILGNDPISQYYENFPEDFYSRSFEPIAVELENEEIARTQLVAMARDNPIRLSELSEFEHQVAMSLVSEGYLKYVKTRGYLKCTSKGLRYLRKRSSLRGVGEIVRIYDVRGRLVGYREMPMALKELFPGAIYLHSGSVYISVKFSPPRAVVRRLPPSFNLITSPLYYSEPSDFRAELSRSVHGVEIEYGSLNVRESVYGYVVKDFSSGAVLRESLLDREYNYEFKTKGLLIHFPVNPEWRLMENAEAFHAVEHALISATQTVVGASPTDMGGISFPTGHVFIYDSFPGGSGITKLLFSRIEEAIKRAYRIVSTCSCADGCPRCIYSPYCGNNNKILSRRRAIRVLRKLLRGELRELVLPVKPEGRPLV